MIEVNKSDYPIIIVGLIAIGFAVGVLSQNAIIENYYKKATSYCAGYVEASMDDDQLKFECITN